MFEPWSIEDICAAVAPNADFGFPPAINFGFSAPPGFFGLLLAATIP